jgi:hypothetical protein
MSCGSMTARETGKSTMPISLTEELSTTFSETDGKVLGYFFYDSDFD